MIKLTKKQVINTLSLPLVLPNPHLMSSLLIEDYEQF
ncbi:Uncharacterised protein [Serratia marcescens]|nr:Uncharacterised protein [Serratia marcescens]CUY21466.1 Uncharacterised protein [Serratia marcescens]CUZ34376.1 Uncharacterised protein [Serratia marcescens]CUZ66069.1 Uncharacterised protein [Serratia marcescens]CVB38820.1 Uncharacterised protein [Serratia marcescens]